MSIHYLIWALLNKEQLNPYERSAIADKLQALIKDE